MMFDLKSNCVSFSFGSVRDIRYYLLICKHKVNNYSEVLLVVVLSLHGEF